VPKPEAKSTLYWIASYPRSGSTAIRMYLFNLVGLMHGLHGELNINWLRFFSPSDVDRIFYGKHLDWRQHRSPESVAAVLPQALEDMVKDAGIFLEESNNFVFVQTNRLLGTLSSHPAVDPKSGWAVYIVRNPLDVAISLAHQFCEPIDTAINFMCRTAVRISNSDTVVFLPGSWSQNVDSWTGVPDPGIIVIRYEDLISDPDVWFGALTRSIFRNSAPPTKQIQLAIEASSFKRMKAQEERFGYNQKWTDFTRFFIEGRSGYWKTVLSSRQVETIVRFHGAAMSRFGYLPG